MAQTGPAGPSRVVVPVTPTLATGGFVPPIVEAPTNSQYASSPQDWAPAWFYSALAFLRTSYIAADGSAGAFGPVLAGSGVDPYACVGANKLFAVYYSYKQYILAVAPTLESAAIVTEASPGFDLTDAGIGALYQALSATEAFAASDYVYVPGAISPPSTARSFSGVFPWRDGYDPATGLRVIDYGSAVAQAVPVSTFLTSGSVQSYSPTPRIAPLCLSLVYDIRDHRGPGDMAFSLPTVYTTDTVEDGNTYANRLSGVTEPLARPTQGPDPIGVLTYTGASPRADFAHQTITGFHREADWTTCLGTPIYDYGPADASFTATSGAYAAPVVVFDPADSPFNGGTLPAVLDAVRRASTLSNDEQLLGILRSSVTAGESGGGLIATTADLAFDLSSAAGTAAVDRLDVPVVATVTVDPPASPATRVARREPIGHLPGEVSVPIGGVNAPPPPATPTTSEVSLNGFVPSEALAGTGILGIPADTAFLPQTLGDAVTFATGPIMLDLTAAPGRSPTPFTLDPATLDVPLLIGAQYVVATAGTAATVRGPDGTVQTLTLAQAPPDPDRRYVGAFVAGQAGTSGSAIMTLYPLTSLTLPLPAPDGAAIRRGASYQVRLTYAASGHSAVDVFGADGTAVATSLTGSGAQPADGSRPRSGDLYFGGFVGGDAIATLWSVPVLAALDAGAVPSGGGKVTVTSRADGPPVWQLAVTDSSLFIHYNMDPDTGAFSTLGASGAYLASGVVNSAPHDRSPAAFAPSALLLGTVRSVSTGTGTKYAFLPQDDSLIVAGVPYLASVIDVEMPTADPTTRPYPPAFWPCSRYWQFANRHDPYLGVGYVGDTQADRIAHAADDIEAICATLTRRQEPMHLYLDTDRSQMTVWPIYGFPFAQGVSSVATDRLAALAGAIARLLDGTLQPGEVAREVLRRGRTGSLDTVGLPASAIAPTPFVGTSDPADGSPPSAPSAPGTTSGPAPVVPTGTVTGRPVSNLAPGALTPRPGLENPLAATASLQTQTQASALADSKRRSPGISVTQGTTGSSGTTLATPARRIVQPVYGFSVYDRQTGEAYLVEVIDADLGVPDRLPGPTTNTDYDPFYVRVVDLSTRAAYQMSIIVPTIAYDQYGYFVREGSEYANVFAARDDFAVGYLHSPHAADEGLASLALLPLDTDAAELAASTGEPGVVFSNLPYATEAVRAAVLSVGRPTTYFLCRRHNWKADCHLMRATRPAGISRYLAFGGGDLVPLRLDKEPVIARTLPGYFGAFTAAFTNRSFSAVKAVRP